MATSSNQLVQIPLCTFCKEEKITDWICTDCDKPLCYECKRCHLWDFERKDHKIISANIPLESKVYGKQILKNLNCKDHKDHLFTNYCIECQCLVCPECVSINSCHMGHTFKTINKLHEETLEELDSLENHIKHSLLGSVTQKLKSLKDWYNFHENKFEEEKEKILKHSDDLRKLITEYSDKLVDKLEQTFARNANIISQEKNKLEQLQRELKENITLINESKVKNDIEQIRKDISNESAYIKHFDIQLCIPKETKHFSVGNVSKESIVNIFGSLQIFDRTADVECKITNSYNLKCFMDQCYQPSVAIASDGTIFIAKGKHLFELKPDKIPQVVVVLRSKITDILFLETNEIIFAVGSSILVKKGHDKIQTLYELENRYYLVLSLCRSRDGNIMILYIWYTNPYDKPYTFYIEVISPDGFKVKTITIMTIGLKTRFYNSFESLIHYLNPTTDLRQYEKVKMAIMTEDRNKNICILNLIDRDVKAYNQEGKLMWQQSVYSPIDMVSTPLGSSVVICEREGLLILNSDGKFVKMINLWAENTLQYPRLHTLSLCFKNNGELALLSDAEKLYIVQFSFAV